MTKKKTALIAAAVLLAVTAVCIYIRFSQALQEPEIPDGDYSMMSATAVDIDYGNLDSVFGLEQSDETIDPNRFDGDYVPKKKAESYESIDYSVDTDLLFGTDKPERSRGQGLLDSVENFDDSALTVIFDNIRFRAGMYVSDIIDNSYWYTDREDELVEPGTAAFVALDNDFWTNEEIKLVDEKTVRNGNIIIWVRNYNSIPVKIRDCVIYKYQISYLGCYDKFSEHPELIYRDFYKLGSSEFPDAANSITTVTTDSGVCTRHIYGEISDCQVILDSNDDGLMGITVSYNEFYGPEFDERR